MTNNAFGNLYISLEIRYWKFVIYDVIGNDHFSITGELVRI